MLQALLADCQRLPQLTVKVLLETRCRQLSAGFPVTSVIIEPQADVLEIFRAELSWAELVWIIAPECDGILQNLTELLCEFNVRSLGCEVAAVALTSHKWRTYQKLKALELPTVSTQLLSEAPCFSPGTWVIKPIDGVGSTQTWRISQADDYDAVLAQLPNPSNFILQPFIAGQVASLSCIFAAGQARILSVNTQNIAFDGLQIQWLGAEVAALSKTATYQNWVDTLAQAIPGLFGYVGIDFIHSAAGDYILEINPRLTTAYVGIFPTLGINVVAEVLQTLEC